MCLRRWSDNKRDEARLYSLSLLVFNILLRRWTAIPRKKNLCIKIAGKITPSFVKITYFVNNNSVFWFTHVVSFFLKTNVSRLLGWSSILGGLSRATEDTLSQCGQNLMF